MPFAARLSDATAYPGVVAGAGAPTVLIGSMPAAAVGDIHVGPRPPAPYLKGSTSVFIGGRPALRAGDVSASGVPIAAGAPTVLIGG